MNENALMLDLQTCIEQAFDQRQDLSPKAVPPELAAALTEVLHLLDQGQIRVAEKKDGQWIVNQWVKKGVLLLFKTRGNIAMSAGFARFFDKIPLKFSEAGGAAALAEADIRVVPPACARQGAFLAPHTVLMPCYVNIGAYVGTGTMVDTWATIGSCAQIGAHVHISGGVGIGGVLEPVQASPTVIEDHCFIGARSEVVEGVIVEQGAVLAMGVYIGQSTPIYNRHTEEITYGRVPAGAVVVPGTLPDPQGKYGRYCAIIMKQVDEQTRQKVSLNELLRGDNQP